MPCHASSCQANQSCIPLVRGVVVSLPFTCDVVLPYCMVASCLTELYFILFYLFIFVVFIFMYAFAFA